MNLGSASLTAGFIIVVFSLSIDKPVLIYCMSVRITSDSFDEESTEVLMVWPPNHHCHVSQLLNSFYITSTSLGKGRGHMVHGCHGNVVMVVTETLMSKVHSLRWQELNITLYLRYCIICITVTMYTYIKLLSHACMNNILYNQVFACIILNPQLMILHLHSIPLVGPYVYKAKAGKGYMYNICMPCM